MFGNFLNAGGKKPEPVEEGPIKTGKEWALLVDDKEFKQYLITRYGNEEISGALFEAICRGFYNE